MLYETTIVVKYSKNTSMEAVLICDAVDEHEATKKVIESYDPNLHIDVIGCLAVLQSCYCISEKWVK